MIDSYDDAMAAAMRLLAAGGKSEARLRERLQARGASSATTGQVLARLKDLRLLDDARHARERARSLLQRGDAPKRVVQKLMAEGLAEAIAAEAVRNETSEMGEEELLRRALDRRRPRVTADSPTPERWKAARWLAGKGFEPDRVRHLLGLPADLEGGSGEPSEGSV